MQVMRYWQWPLQGRGSHAYSLEGSYSCWHYDTLSANFGATTYDWAHMPIRLTDSSSQMERTAVATLLYHCGVAVNMRYNSDCNGSSAALMSSQYYGATRFFGYSNSATLCERANYTDAQWKNLIKNDLDNQIPVLYSGSSYYDPVNGTYSGAHAFIIDGYDNDDYFHVNWGWGGSYDAYFAIEALTPYYYNFSHDENATFGLVPATTGNPPFTDLLQTTSLDTDRVQLARTRDLLYVCLRFPGGDSLHVIVNHWTSRYGGYAATVPKRNACADVARACVDSLLANVPQAHILLMGDFNDYPTDESMEQHLRARRYSPDNKWDTLFNLMYAFEKEPNAGSHKHEDFWGCLDQMVVSRTLLLGLNGMSIVGQKAYILQDDFLLVPDEKYGGVKNFRTFLGPRYVGGFSDHLPVFMTVSLQRR